MSEAINFNKMYQDNERDNMNLQRDPSKENIKKIISNVEERMSLLTKGYLSENSTPERKIAFYSVKALQDSLVQFAEAEFPEGSTLDSVAFNKVLRVRNVVKKMILDGVSEKAARDAILSLYTKEAPSKMKYISKDHQTLKDLWTLYYNQQGSNYLEYFSSARRTNERDQLLKTKIEGNMNNYTGPVQEALLNLLSA